MTDISISSGVRFNLLQLQRNAALREEVSERLSTGQRVNQINDDPQDFATAQALSDRIGDLISTRGEIGQGQSTVNAAQNGLNAIEDLTGQLRGIANAARGGSAEQRQAAAEQFDEIRNQINGLASDASFGGVNLIDDPADTLTVDVGDVSGATVSVEGQATTSNALGVGSAVTDFNNFATDADIQAALVDVSTATGQVRSTQAQFGSDQAVFSARDRFTENLGNTLQASRANLTETDLNDAAARRLALQVQNEVAQNALQFAVRTESLVVDLLSGGSD